MAEQPTEQPTDPYILPVPPEWSINQKEIAQWYNELPVTQKELLDARGWDIVEFNDYLQSGPGGAAGAAELINKANENILTPTQIQAYEDEKEVRGLGLENLKAIEERQKEDRGLRDRYFGRVGGEDRNREQQAMERSGLVGEDISAAEIQGKQAADQVLREAMRAQVGGSGGSSLSSQAAQEGLSEGQLGAGVGAAGMRATEASIGRTGRAALADQIMGGDLAAAGIASGAEHGYVGAGQGAMGVSGAQTQSVYQNQLRDQGQALRQEQIDFKKQMADNAFVQGLVGTGMGAIGSAAGIMSDRRMKENVRTSSDGMELLLRKLRGR